MQFETPRVTRVFWVAGLILLIVANLVVWFLVLSSREQNLTVSFLDVGQGDATLIQTPHGYNILVDGGPNNKVSDHLNQVLPINNRELDLLILTHPQSDHLFGLIEVVKKFKVKKILTSNVAHTTSVFKLWKDTVSSEGLNLEFAKAGETITLSDQVTLRFNWPESNQPLEVEDLNKASVVFTLNYKDLDILMTGDADSQVQPYPGVGEVEVLKVPHHGSKTALSEAFLKNLSPEVSVISAGQKNRHGHPREELLKQLQKVDTSIFRTDRDGTIKIVSDGAKWYTQTEKEGTNQ